MDGNVDETDAGNAPPGGETAEMSVMIHSRNSLPFMLCAGVSPVATPPIQRPSIMQRQDECCDGAATLKVQPRGWTIDDAWISRPYYSCNYGVLVF